jgi:hypothetical protein
MHIISYVLFLKTSRRPVRPDPVVPPFSMPFTLSHRIVKCFLRDMERIDFL